MTLWVLFFSNWGTWSSFLSPRPGVVVVVVGVVAFPFGKPSVGSILWYWKPYTFLEFIIVIMLLPPQKPTATEPELFTPKKKDKKRNIIIHLPWFLGSSLGSCFGETIIGQSICQLSYELRHKFLVALEVKEPQFCYFWGYFRILKGHFYIFHILSWWILHLFLWQMSRFSSSSGRLEMYARHPGGDYKLLGRGTANRFENSFFGGPSISQAGQAK